METVTAISVNRYNYFGVLVRTERHVLDCYLRRGDIQIVPGDKLIVKTRVVSPKTGHLMAELTPLPNSGEFFDRETGPLTWRAD